MLIGTGSPAAANDDKYAFNRPATLTFPPGGGSTWPTALSKRVRIFDLQGRFLGNWTDLGTIQGLY